MDSSKELQRRVLDELDWEPSVNAAHIGVAVNDGVVTLTGAVTTYAEKVAAEHATKRLIGVKAVANDLEVRPASPTKPNDTEIAQAAIGALEWDVSVPHELIKTRVANGLVTLEGEVKFWYQRQAAENAVRGLKGVQGVINLISIRPALRATDVKSRIESAFRRSAEIDASRIQVETSDGTVKLRGRVRSWGERQEAEKAAWAAPGVI
ncbi:MAG TPA: BON domain-containing protein, partial [Anaerolineales bacterium]